MAAIYKKLTSFFYTPWGEYKIESKDGKITSGISPEEIKYLKDDLRRIIGDYDVKINDNDIITYNKIMKEQLDSTKAFYMAAKNGSFPLLQYFEDEAKPKNKEYNVALYNAAEGGHVDIIKYLESKTNIRYTPAMTHAVRNGQFDVIKYLSTKNIDYSFPIAAASEKGNLDMVKYLLKYATPETFEYKMSIRGAARGLHRDIVEYLANRFDINGKYEDGKTILHMGVLLFPIPALEILLDNDADLFIPNNEGKTPIDMLIDIVMDNDNPFGRSRAISKESAQERIQFIDGYLEARKNIVQEELVEGGHLIKDLANIITKDYMRKR